MSAGRGEAGRRARGRPRPMSEREYSERPWGNYTVLDDDAPDHKVKRLVVHPGKRLSYQRHCPAGRALVHRRGHGRGDAGRRADRAARRASPSTSPWRVPTASATRATPTWCLIEVQHGTTSARTTSSGSRTTSAGSKMPRPGRARRDPHRRAARGRPDVLLRVLSAEERQGAARRWPARSPSCSRSSRPSSRSPTAAAPSRASARSTSCRACCTRRASTRWRT